MYGDLMNKYEYTRITEPIDPKFNELEEMMTALGQFGWRCIHIYDTTLPRQATLERAIESTPIEKENIEVTPAKKSYYKRKTA